MNTCSSFVRNFFGVVIIIVLGIGILVFPQHIFASTFTVNSTADTTDDVIGDGICADSSGDCTLRAALKEHNIFGTTDTIILPAGTYTLTITGTGEDSGATGDLDIGPSGNLTIIGAGASTTIIDANGIDRVVDIKRQTPVLPPVVTISGVTIKNGSISGANGGGIYVHKSGIGGGSGPSVTLTDVQILNNTSINGSGGGIYVDGNSGLDMTSGTIANNTASGTGAGGGITTYGGNGTFTNVTVSGNSAGSGGGGGILEGSTNSFINVTVYNNTATTGAGIYLVDSTATLLNTLVAYNGTNNCAITGTFTPTSLGYNLSNDSSCSSIFNATGDQNNRSVSITSTLAYNGGLTQSHALPDGSSAIDAGANNGCPTTDQRGVTRPQDGNQDGNNVCDIGAYEFQVTPPGPSATPIPDPNSCGDATPGQVTNVYISDEALNDGRVTVQWIPPGGASQAHIRYGEQNGIWNYSLINTANDGTEIISGLGLGQSYYFQVAAVNGCQVGPWSASFGPVPQYGNSSPLPSALLMPSPSSQISESPLPSGLLPSPSELPIANIIPIPQNIPPNIIPIISGIASVGFGVTALGMLAAGSANLATGMSAGLSFVYHGFDELISIFLSYFGIIKRRRKSLGIVFDALHNKPLAHAYVVLHSESGNLKSTFTNRDGRFQISALPDTYTLKAQFSGYDFPSTIITVPENQQYAHIYLPNEQIVITNEIMANIAVPLDPALSGFGRFWHKLSNYGNYILIKLYNGLFIGVTFLLAINAWYRPSTINTIALAISVTSILLNWILSFAKSANWGIVKDHSGKPLKGQTVKLFQNGERLDLYTSTTTDSKGRYLFTPENGQYQLQISDESGQVIYQKDVTVTDDEPKVSLQIML